MFPMEHGVSMLLVCVHRRCNKRLQVFKNIL